MSWFLFFCLFLCLFFLRFCFFVLSVLLEVSGGKAKTVWCSSVCSLSGLSKLFHHPQQLRHPCHQFQLPHPHILVWLGIKENSDEVSRLSKSHKQTNCERPNENSPVLPKEHEAAYAIVKHGLGSVGGIQVEASNVFRTDCAFGPRCCLGKHVD